MYHYVPFWYKMGCISETAFVSNGKVYSFQICSYWYICNSEASEMLGTISNTLKTKTS